LTKNAQKARDPEMHQTKKGNQWYFGMKAHLGVGVDASERTENRTKSKVRAKSLCPRKFASA
jgi:IS5 family transposase